MTSIKAKREQRIYRTLLAATVFILAFGTVFYHFVEGWPWVDAYYFCVVTLATIGYGDFIPQSTFAKIFTTIYIFVGIGILTAFIRTFLTHHGQRIVERYSQKPNIFKSDDKDKP